MKTYVSPGQTVRMEIAFSEAAMSMRIAGQVLDVQLVPAQYGACAQVYKNGFQYSFPITTGEAGFYQDDGGYYYYPPAEPESEIERACR